MAGYKVCGEKSGKFRAFNTLNYVDRVVTALGMQYEEVDHHHPAFGRLFKWLQTAVAARKQDITRRKALARRAKEDRENKIRLSEERAVNRVQYLADAEEKFKDENREAIEAFEKYQEEQKLKDS